MYIDREKKNINRKEGAFDKRRFFMTPILFLWFFLYAAFFFLCHLSLSLNRLVFARQNTVFNNVSDFFRSILWRNKMYFPGINKTKPAEKYIGWQPPLRQDTESSPRIVILATTPFAKNTGCHSKA